MRRFLALPVAALTLAVAASTAPQASLAAPAKPASGGQCFFSRDISSFAPTGRDGINFRVGVSDYYHADLFSDCPDLPFAQGIGLRTRGSGTSICGPLDAELMVGGPTGPQRCLLKDLRKLTKDEVAALPKRDKP